MALVGLLFKATDYGGGTDLWNVSKATYKHFTKVNTLFLSNLSLDQGTTVAASFKERLTYCHA